MPVTEPVPGPGAFQWNRGGWFGGQLGSTVWLLVGAAFIADQLPWVSVAWLVYFALANSLGTWLWRHRERLRPYPAYQLLLLTVGIIGLIALLTLDLLRPDNVRLTLTWEDGQFRLIDTQPSQFRLGYFSCLVILPALMGFTALQEWAARRARS